MKIFTFLLLTTVLAACHKAPQSAGQPNTTDISREHPAPGTTLVRFEQLDEGVYKGSKPKNEADFEFLESKGIKYIVKLRFFPVVHVFEKRKAKAHGMTVIQLPINASPMHPTEKHINNILCLLRDKRYHPIYFHCDLGRDRAMLIAGLYDLYYRGKSKEEAWEHMKKYDFHDGWGLRGLKEYFERHSTPPIESHVPDCSRYERQNEKRADASGSEADSPGGE